ncbi:MAG: flagellar hook capping FlgD N-terminal domain-containing protein [Pseudomonadota bacterium]
MTTSVSSAQGATASTAPSSGGTALDKDAFLRLLVTQLQNQDPLAPTDSTAFVAQLAQFSGLEAMVEVRDSVDALSFLQTAATNAQVASLVGREVAVRGDWFELLADGTPVDLHFDLGGAASSVEITVYDEDGHKVRTLSLTGRASGSNSVAFDGRDDDGNRLSAGHYTFKVSASDTDGRVVDSATRACGRVTGLSYENGYPELLFGAQRVPLGDVIEIRV